MTKTIAVIKDGSSFYAIEADCKHQNANLLSRGMKSDVVACPRHGWRYNMKTGECVSHDSPPLRRYPLKFEGETIFVGTKPEESESDNEFEDDFF